MRFLPSFGFRNSTEFSQMSPASNLSRELTINRLETKVSAKEVSTHNVLVLMFANHFLPSRF